MAVALIIVIVIILLALGGAYYYYCMYKKQELQDFLNNNKFVHDGKIYKFTLDDNLILTITSIDTKRKSKTKSGPIQATLRFGKLLWEVGRESGSLYKKGNLLIAEDDGETFAMKLAS